MSAIEFLTLNTTIHTESAILPPDHKVLVSNNQHVSWCSFSPMVILAGMDIDGDRRSVESRSSLTAPH